MATAEKAVSFLGKEVSGTARFEHERGRTWLEENARVNHDYPIDEFLLGHARWLPD